MGFRIRVRCLAIFGKSPLRRSEEFYTLIGKEYRANLVTRVRYIYKFSLHAPITDRAEGLIPQLGAAAREL